MAQEELVDRVALVNLAVVEQGDDVSAEMAQDVFEERADHFAVDVRVEQLAVQPRATPLRADGDPGDGRDPVVAVEVMEDRRPPARTPRPAHRRDQEKARFVEEKEIGPQPCGVFFRRGQTVRFHRAIASSSRSTARRSGFWGVHPNSCRSLPT